MRLKSVFLIHFLSFKSYPSLSEIKELSLGMPYEEVIEFLDDNKIDIDYDMINLMDNITNYELIETDEGAFLKQINNPKIRIDYIPLKSNSFNLDAVGFCENKGKLNSISQTFYTNNIQDFIDKIIFYEEQGYLLKKNKLMYSEKNLNLKSPNLFFIEYLKDSEPNIIFRLMPSDQKKKEIAYGVSKRLNGDFCNR